MKSAIEINFALIIKKHEQFIRNFSLQSSKFSVAMDDKTIGISRKKLMEEKCAGPSDFTHG